MICGTKDTISFKGLYENQMNLILYKEEYDDNSKIKIIELQNPWGTNEQKDAEQFDLNLDEKYKYIEDNLKKLFSDNIKIEKIKILIKNFKGQFFLLRGSSFQQNFRGKQKRNRKKLWWNFFSLATRTRRWSKN